MNDSEILDLYFDRDEKALSETASKYGMKLSRLSFNITGDMGDAEECVNDTYFEAWRRIPPTRPDCFFSWLSKVTRNFSLKKWEKLNTKKRSGNIAEIDDELLECIPDKEGNVEISFENRRLAKSIDEFVRALDENQRKLFMQRYFWNEPLCEIAKRENISQSKLKSLFYRLRMKLKEKLEKEDFDV